MNETTTMNGGRRAAFTRRATTAAVLTVPLLAPRARAHTDKPHAPRAGPAVNRDAEFGFTGLIAGHCQRGRVGTLVVAPGEMA